MGLREFFATMILGYEPAPKPKPKIYWHPSDPIQLLQHDASLLLRRIYAGGSSDRAGMIATRRMTHSRWTKAFRLLVSLAIINKRKEINMTHAPTVEIAEERLKYGLLRRVQTRAAGRFVPPRRGDR